jgi:DNA modification methylase
LIDLRQGDCLEILPTLDAASVDAVVTDPPYGLEFMGKEWDKLGERGRHAGTERKSVLREMEFKDFGTMPNFSTQTRNPKCRTCNRYKWDHVGRKCECEAPEFEHRHMGNEQQAFHHAWATAVLRVLRPAGYLLAFGGTRTYHRLACAVEDAGFEVRDCLMWVYGSGFPKGRGCLKPAWEPILLCRKPGAKVEPLGIDECRVAGVPPSVPQPRFNSPTGQTYGMKTGEGRNGDMSHAAGRWPANVVHDGSDEVQEAFAAFGESTGAHGRNGKSYGPKPMFNGSIRETCQEITRDTGSAARFFYTAKASRREREDGLEGMPKHEESLDKWQEKDRRSGTARQPTEWVRKPVANHHPTVKPLALLEWLVKLACPPGGVVLDPFLGSGTTAVACWRTDRQCIGIERDAEYFRLAERRVEAARQKLGLFAELD